MSGNDVLLAVVLVMIALGFAVMAVVVWVIGRRNLLTPRRRVLVNLVDDTTIEGVLWSRTLRQIVVRDAVVHEGAAAARADGEIVVDAAQVRFVQVTR